MLERKREKAEPECVLISLIDASGSSSAGEWSVCGDEYRKRDVVFFWKWWV